MSGLNDIALKHGCDKSSKHHDYCKVYERYFDRLRNEPVNLLEIGYGGYDDPNAGGESARMWSEYLPNAQIVITDIHHKDNVPEGVIFHVHDANVPMGYPKPYFDIIIDDGSHLNNDIITAFKNLWDHLKPGGIYAIEDLHSSYDRYYKDSHHMPGQGNTAMRFLQRLTDEINKDFHNYPLGYDIEFIHFYRELCLLKKR